MSKTKEEIKEDLKEKEEKIPSTATLLSAESWIMLIIAGFLDIFGLVGFIPVIGQIISYVPDILGLLTIGFWTYFRSQNLQVTSGTAAKIGSAAKWGKRLKWLRPLFVIGEFIPIAGIAPLWIILVYLELKK